jgi:hypothetical protein
MRSMDTTELKLPEGEEGQEVAYEAPAIVYEGLITARAGSQFSIPDGDADPAGLFSK